VKKYEEQKQRAALRAGARAVPRTEQKIFAATTSTLAEAGLW
jgi:hypothetical protein